MIRLAPATAIIMVVSMAAMAQSASSEVGPPARFMPTMPADATTVTNYYKQSVYDPSNTKIGEILDLMVERDGRITAAMVGVGGFLGIDQKIVAIPFDALTVSRKNNHRRLTLNTTKNALKSAAGFTYDRATAVWISDKSVSNVKIPLYGHHAAGIVFVVSYRSFPSSVNLLIAASVEKPAVILVCSSRRQNFR
jgi:sporulation protein YlmC with PRC-barrel domain